MAYQVLYRTYRPKNFDSVVGLETVIRVLKNQIKNNQIGHAYIFSGPRGTGKTSMAKIFAKAINCLAPEDDRPCGKCDNCLSIEQNSTMDIVEIDAASNNGVDEIRDLRDKVKYLTSNLKYKVYIIDEFHMLTTQAFNALLKTLEEPPSHIVFILATTELHKVPSTILSRCQRFTFSNISESDVIKKLKEIAKAENIKYEDGVLEMISRISEGGLRDAISLLDQSLSFSDEEITLECINQITGGVSTNTIKELLDSIMDANIKNIIQIFDKQIDSGRDINRLLSDLLIYIKDTLIAQVNASVGAPRYMEKLSAASTKIAGIINLIKYSNQKKILAQMELINLAFSLNEKKREEKATASATTIKENVVDKNKYAKIELSDIERLMNEASPEVRKKVEEKLYENFGSSSEKIITSFSKLKVAASSNSEVLFVAKSASDASYLMGTEIKKVIVDEFKKDDLSIKNYFIINQKEWDLIFSEVKKQRLADKTAKISLSDIEISEFYEKNNTIVLNNTEKGKMLFGDDLIIKGEGKNE